MIQGYKIQVDKLKSENKNLNSRLEKTLRDDHKKMDEERSAHMLTKSKLRQMEEYGERMDIQNENLKKKVNFFKNQNISKSQAFTTMKSPDQTSCKLIETSMVKEHLLYMQKQIFQIKELHAREKSRLLQEMGYFRNSVASMTDVLAIRIREESKKSKYYEKDISRLKKDIHYLQRINEEFSIRADKSHIKSQISKMSPVDFDSNYTSTQTYDISTMPDPMEYKSPSNFGQTGHNMSPINKVDSTPIRDDVYETNFSSNSFVNMSKLNQASVDSQNNFNNHQPHQENGRRMTRDKSRGALAVQKSRTDLNGIEGIRQRSMKRNRSRNLYSLNKGIHSQRPHHQQNKESLHDKENMIDQSNISSSNNGDKRASSKRYLTFQESSVLTNNISSLANNQNERPEQFNSKKNSYPVRHNRQFVRKESQPSQYEAKTSRRSERTEDLMNFKLDKENQSITERNNPIYRPPLLDFSKVDQYKAMDTNFSENSKNGYHAHQINFHTCSSNQNLGNLEDIHSLEGTLRGNILNSKD